MYTFILAHFQAKTDNVGPSIITRGNYKIKEIGTQKIEPVIYLYKHFKYASTLQKFHISLHA